MLATQLPAARRSHLGPGSPHPQANNALAADIFERVADYLAAQQADPYRVRAYRRAALTLRELEYDVAALVGHRADGTCTDAEARELKRLSALPHIGIRLAGSILEILHTGKLRLLDRLRGEVSPEGLFATVPGIGEELAHRIVDKLHIDTLEELELAAHDGRLAGVSGFGERRVRAMRDQLATLLRRSPRRAARLVDTDTHVPPPIDVLLAVDAEYRSKARAGTLHRIAPRRFNPRHEPWLPVLHVEEEGWSFTAMFSNTAKAHRLGHTRDWVVIYYERDGDEHQCTVVTEYAGPDGGLRVVRGRERDCHAHYVRHPPERPRFEVPVFL